MACRYYSIRTFLLRIVWPCPIQKVKRTSQSSIYIILLSTLTITLIGNTVPTLQNEQRSSASEATSTHRSPLQHRSRSTYCCLFGLPHQGSPRALGRFLTAGISMPENAPNLTWRHHEKALLALRFVIAAFYVYPL